MPVMGQVVAVIGASNDRRKFGNKAVRAFQQAGYDVIPINPRAAIVEGLTTYRSVLDVPRAIDLVTVYVPPDVALGLLPEFVTKHVGEVWFNPGADDDALVVEARRLGLRAVVACSIVSLGRDPNTL